MALMKWQDSFSIGNPLLDSDHRILVNLLNQLHDALDTGQSRKVVGSVIGVLAEYVEHHFRREEALLARTDYPDRVEHEKAHRALEARVRDIRDRWIAGERSALGDEVLEFLKKWLTEHILVSDKAYGPWLADEAGGDEGKGRQHS